MVVTVFIAAAMAVMGIGFGQGFHDAAWLLGLIFGASIIAGAVKEIFKKDK